MARKIAYSLVLVFAGMFLMMTGLSVHAARTAGAADVAPAAADDHGNLIRLHVVANSDSDEDQDLKRAVRDAILEKVTPLFLNAASVVEAKAAVEGALPEIEQVAANVITANGKGYAVEAEVGRFDFPGKAYGETYLPAGEYTALRVLIGEANGANWWCVLFPPLCFVDWTTGIVQEPVEGGARTVAVARSDKQVAPYDGEPLKRLPVKPRFALLSLFKAR